MDVSQSHIGILGKVDLTNFKMIRMKIGNLKLVTERHQCFFGVGLMDTCACYDHRIPRIFQKV